MTTANPDGTPGEPQPLAEYFAVSEEKLRAIPAAKLQEMVGNGAVAQIYAHLHSLIGWDRLVTLALSRAPAMPTPANVN
jgi:hypothetical protein